MEKPLTCSYPLQPNTRRTSVIMQQKINLNKNKFTENGRML